MFDARQFWRSIFLESSWSADLWASLFFAIPFSAMSEVLADSGEWRGGRMITSTAVAAGAYLASYFMFRARTPSKLRIPSWIYVGGVGSLFYAFIWRLIYRPVVGWSETRIDSLEEYLQGMVHDVRAFFILVVLVPPLCVSVLLAIRLVKALMLAYTSDGQERVNLP